VNTRDRRSAARARLEREMAARAETARRRRRLQTTIAVVAVAALLVGLTVWIVIATGDDDSSNTAQPLPSTSSGPLTCAWTPLFNPSASPSGSPQPTPSGVKEVGTPPTNPPRTGTQVMTIDTNLGPIKIEMDLSKVPCTAASLGYLASKGFYNNSKCHRMVTSIGALQCGDPGGAGTGGPTYRFDSENLPVGRKPAYTRGLVAMANSGSSDSNGSQFFFLWKDSALPAQYTVIGKVTQGIEIVDKVAAGGDNGEYEASGAGGGRPNTEIVFKSVTVG